MAMRHVKCVAVGDSGVGENKYKYKKTANSQERIGVRENLSIINTKT